MLVIVEYRDIAAFAQFFLNVKTLGRFDVFQVDTTESGFQRSDGINQFIRIGFVDFDIEYIDTGEFFEQYAFAFHYRLTGQRADIAQAQNGGTIGHHAHQIAA